MALGATVFGQPRGIFVLFLVEMWERFSYYGMRSLLVLYLTEHFAIADTSAIEIYGAYTSMAYGAAVLGGFAADRLIGSWRSIVIGALLIVAGHLSLVVEGLLDPTQQSTMGLFFAALALIVVGTGLFKPNATMLVGTQYALGDARRTTGFYIFYVGINLGSALAALVCGWLGQRFGWSYGFGAAALGMTLGLAILGTKRAAVSIPVQDLRCSPSIAVAVVISAIASSWFVMQRPVLVGLLLFSSLALGLCVVFSYMLREANAAARRKICAALILIASACVFWSLFEQAGSSLNLFAARMVRLSVGSVTILSSQTQFFNPAYILALTPGFAWLWLRMARAGTEPSVTLKNVLALVQVGLGFVSLTAGIRLSSGAGTVALGWLALAYFLHTTGELCLSPPGYAAMTQLAPPRIAGVIMGLWMFALSIGNFLGAKIAVLTVRPGGAMGGVAARSAEISGYAHVFWQVVVVAGLAAAALALLVRPMRRWSGGLA